MWIPTTNRRTFSINYIISVCRYNRWPIFSLNSFWRVMIFLIFHGLWLFRRNLFILKINITPCRSNWRTNRRKLKLFIDLFFLSSFQLLDVFFCLFVIKNNLIAKNRNRISMRLLYFRFWSWSLITKNNFLCFSRRSNIFNFWNRACSVSRLISCYAP